MVRFIRSVVVSIGMMPRALEFARSISSHMSEKHGQKIDVYMESAGILYWISDYPDFETYGRIRSEIATDEEYWRLIEDAADCFVDGSIQDIVLSRI